MSEIDNGIESGAISESNVSSETASPAQSQETSSSQDAASTQVKETPFHEHPRFKELISERNQEREARTSLERNYQQIQAQLQQLQQQYQNQSKPKAPSYDNLFKDLEQANPEFAQMQREAYTKLSELDQLKLQVQQQHEFMQEQTQQRNAEAAQSKLQSLFTENKVPDNVKGLYEQAIANMAFNSNAKVSDLPDLFKKAHANLSKTLEDLRRSDRESYVAAKKTDKAPTTQTGGTAAGTGKAGPQTLDEVKAALAAQLRAGSVHI